MKYVLLFFTGALQVALVAANTWQIAHEKWIGMFFIGFGISFVWVFNVKRAAFSNWKEKIIYPLGAAFGTIIGVLLTKWTYGA